MIHTRFYTVETVQDDVLVRWVGPNLNMVFSKGQPVPTFPNCWKGEVG